MGEFFYNPEQYFRLPNQDIARIFLHINHRLADFIVLGIQPHVILRIVLILDILVKTNL